MKKKLEIMSAGDLNLVLPHLERSEFILKDKCYINLGESLTPYFRIPKKKVSFIKKANNLITKMGRKIKADLAVIKYTNTWYTNNTINYQVVFYREKIKSSENN